ncbi:choice-of-anchor J domain-containing protein, partial [uncultured Alcanivorax sp.]|uniref:choice-of-anchor J domain-containing protein n=1 Tax=uncultured Alcanivorax sp. TaxID=191215 RepID=UPI002613B29F
MDAVFFEDFDPYTGSATELPMDGWTILDNNGDADSIPQLYKTWYHDDYGVSGAGDGNMVAYIGFSNNYDADETMVTPMIHLPSPSKVTFQAYDYAVNLDVGYTESSTIDSSAELPHIATKYVDGFYTTMYEVMLPDV